MRAGLQKSEQHARGWVSRVGGALSKGLLVAGSAAVATIGAIGGAALKAAFDAMPLEGIRGAFQGITQDSGETMAALRAGSLGMITDAALMEKYNLAASLVGKTFADDLPEAMQYLSKVSAATGQDMDYMMSSLVTGIGRLSPMILDNLAIQVDLVAANEDYAKSMGITTAEMTKEQEQAALMIQVMDKLKANTASMPDVLGSATQTWASFRTMLANTKDTIGLALLPGLSSLLGTLGSLAEKVLPPLVSFIEGTVAPAFEKFAGGISDFVWMLESGIAPMDAFKIVLGMLFGPETAATVMAIVGNIQTFIATLSTWAGVVKATVLPILRQMWAWLEEKIPEAIDTLSGYWTSTLQPALEQIRGFIEENLTPILAGLAAILLVVVIPAIVAWASSTVAAIAATIAAAAPIILILAAVGLAVGLLAKAWESDWLGIRTTLTKYIEESTERLRKLVAWFKETIPEALATLRDWFTTAWANITAAVSSAWEFLVALFETLKVWFTETMPNALSEAWETIKTTLQEALDAVKQKIDEVLTGISTFWQETWTAITTFLQETWAMIQESFVIALEAIVTLWQTTWESITTFLQTTWENIKLILLTALILILDFFGINLEELLLMWQLAWTAISEWLTTTWETMKTTITTVFTAIKTWIEETLANLSAIWTAVWTAISTKASEIWTAIKTTVTTIFTAIKTWVETTLANISAGWTTVWTAIKTTATTIWTSIKLVVLTVFTAIKTWLESKMSALSAAWTTAWTAIKTKVSEIWETIKTAVSEAITAVVTSLTEKYEEIKSAITDPLNDAFEAIKGKISEWVQIGRDILGGLISGAKAKAQSMIDAIVGPIRDAIARAKALLHMGSPSKVFAEMGKASMQGMAQGVLANADLPVNAIGSAMGAIVNRAGDVYNYTIHRDAYPESTDSDMQADIRFLRFAGAGVRSGS